MPKKARDICVIRVLSSSGVEIHRVKGGRLWPHRERQASRSLRNLDVGQAAAVPVASQDWPSCETDPEFLPGNLEKVWVCPSSENLVVDPFDL